MSKIINEDAICQAILEKKLIGFYYEGHHRCVEPHVYGVDDGEARLLAYQMKGRSNGGGNTNWRQFKTDKMVNVRVLGESFEQSRLKSEPDKWDRYIAIVD
jgi:predicted DNA-binding transcriptional regulator YafY